MSEVPAWSTPAAIIIAGALAGLGAYFGLKADGEPNPSLTKVSPAAADSAGSHDSAGNASPATAPSATSTPDAGTAARQGAQGPATEPSLPSAPIDRSALDSEVHAAAMKALEAAKPAIIRDCWEPSFAENPEPAQIKLGFSLSFRKSGKMVASGVIEDREARRPDMFDCLAAAAHALEIPPQPTDVTTQIEFTLP